MDCALFRWVNDLADRTGWAHGPFTIYARYGIVVFAVVLLGSFLDARRRGDTRALAGAAWAGGAPLVALLVGQIIGHVVGRARPYDAMSGVHVLIARTADFSFPSDHATAAGAVAVGLLLANRRWGLVAAVAALFMAVARVYVGVHYPGDVIAGLALGGLVAVAGSLVLVPVLDRLTQRVPQLCQTTTLPAISALTPSTLPADHRRVERRWTSPTSNAPHGEPSSAGDSLRPAP
jgi:membrane-associated phospholipid phosphatase